MIELYNSAGYIKYGDTEEGSLERRAAQLINIYVNLSDKYLPAFHNRFIDVRITELTSTTIVELVKVVVSTKMGTNVVGALGVRITGRKEEVIWVDYTKCHYWVSSVHDLMGNKERITLGEIVYRAPHMRHSLKGISPSSLINIKLSGSI